MAQDIQRRFVYYQGTVQGVGFRYTTLQISHRHRVVGYVRNLPNGEVEVCVEGETDEIDRFQGDIAARMAANIRSARVETVAPTGEFDSFEIRH